MRALLLLALLAAVTAILAALVASAADLRAESAGDDPGLPPRGAIVRRPPHEIELAAIVNAHGFNESWLMPGYHAMVWDGGKAARYALLRAEPTDVEVLDALEALGGRPGDNVPLAAWDERKDESSKAPDTVVAGSPVEVLLRLPGRRALVPLAEILEDPAGHGFEGRFGGNRAHLEHWKSGCMVCLYSCPGGKVSNARYTLRDYARSTTRWRARVDRLPADGTRIGVILRLAPDTPPAS